MKFAALAGTVTGYGDRGVDGTAYSSRDGYLFADGNDDAWWIVFQPSSGAGVPGAQARGDVLACSDAHGELIRVRVLAGDVLRRDADAAFREHAPLTYEDAVAVAADLPAHRG
ncbi:hypothetical protein [Pseudarthrobacter sp. S9]|uniref:hypothetical protein n=1 Tax=Pseudarthrobacter sp. S9 TaxID=3418421 RepID=UPI003CFE3CC7